MSETRYQVFVSSTFTDLQAERRAVMEALLENDCFPAGMELFPAADEDQFEFIKTVIADSDYYVLLIAGRYGSLAPDGISYTEKEYDYAVSIGKHVIAFIHGSPDEIVVGKAERDPALVEKLKAFIGKVKTGRLIKTWQSSDELKYIVSTSLRRAIRMHPSSGWVRGGAISSHLLLAGLSLNIPWPE